MPERSHAVGRRAEARVLRIVSGFDEVQRARFATPIEDASGVDIIAELRGGGALRIQVKAGGARPAQARRYRKRGIILVRQVLRISETQLQTQLRRLLFPHSGDVNA